MPELETDVYIDKNGKPHLLEESRPKIHSFCIERKNKWIKVIYRDLEDIRSNSDNKRLWIIYGYFIPDHFNTTDEAHEHFTRQFLKRRSIIDTSSPNKDREIEKIRKEARRILHFDIETTEDNQEHFKIEWIKSTTVLSKKNHKQYRELIMTFGATELNITFPEDL